MFTNPDSPAAVGQSLSDHGYLSDTGLTTAVFLAMTMSRPLFLEGDPGVGKTELAKVLSTWTGGDLIRLQCYEGIDSAQALYEWDYPKQLLHLRSSELLARDGAAGSARESELYSEKFLIRRPLLQALDYHGAGIPVLLIDEIDRADDEFEAFLLEILSEFSVTIPELGQISAKRVPLVVITSNRTRDVHDALKRRCLYHWISHPTLEREIDILKLKAPDVGEVLSRQVASAVQQMRSFGLFKPPGVAETIDWATALGKLGEAKLTEESLGATLGAVLKYREDQERVVSQGLNIILSAVSDA
ncbi:MAG: MoxR family ATPase [Actinomycetota bacterium]|nr:MoxR family ATPase [Actinomycetota bacterium]MDG1489680.1 MoxR family ATPase [Actinomycetota bacterium]MDG2121663.1 MoxR family ATPase [Actinomycetota bacterium]